MAALKLLAALAIFEGCSAGFIPSAEVSSALFADDSCRRDGANGCGLQALQTSISAVRNDAILAASSSSTPDILSRLVNEPQGAYLEELGPVVQAISLSYKSSPGPDGEPSKVNATISIDRQNWERLFEMDLDTAPGGIHGRVFAERSKKRAIVAYRGSCLDKTIEQCHYDICVLRALQAFGGLSNVVYDIDQTVCDKLGPERLISDFLQQADEFARSAQQKLPGFDMMLVGHSLGGLLAIVTAARQPGVLKAITFAPTPFHDALLLKFGWSEQQIEQLPHDSLVAMCDPYDCGLNTLYVSKPRKGAQTCLYFGLRPSEDCSRLPVQPYDDSKWREVLQPTGDMGQAINVLKCKGGAHAWEHYEEFVLAQDSDGRPLHLPTCSAEFSVLQSMYSTSLLQLS
eukprot:gb/GFBE01063135.1/.p1 GENE.gb/GFBE01063135.1/~~gb/GFBE01063135.1/.p1  ORF type:complete len:401 (+),score=95.62 gb/GFBE01063135.1/:1-1203(+)